LVEHQNSRYKIVGLVNASIGTAVRAAYDLVLFRVGVSKVTTVS